MKLHVVEGNTQMLDGGAMFGNAPRAMWEQWISPDEGHRIRLACRALLLVTDDGKKILFETGIGAFFEPKLRERYGIVESHHVLIDNLRMLGFTESDIDVVVLSHLHFDHAGGLLSAFEEGEPRLLFPKAQFYVGERHWERALRPHSRDRASFIPVLHDLLQQSGRLTLVKDTEPSPLAPLVEFRFSDGHTVGLMLSQINLVSGPLVFSSDLIPGAPWVHVPISMGYDRFPELLVDEKRNLLEELERKGGSLYFTHDQSMACGRIKKDAKGRYTVASLELKNLCEA